MFFSALCVMVGITIIISSMAAVLSRWLVVSDEGGSLVDAVNNLLPQIQCGQCGYPGCRPYAKAICQGEAGINQCPPGGESVILALADLLGREPEELDQNYGQEKEPGVALVLEHLCIGCTLCIQACPFDAIVGAPRCSHTVVIDLCTGCELCIPPCPVNCIEIHPMNIPISKWRKSSPRFVLHPIRSL